MLLKSDYNVYFSSSFFLKSFLRLFLLLTQLFSSSSDVGVKNLANSLTREGPIHLRGSSWMSCNLSVFESLLLWTALAFSACTCFLDPLSLGHLRGYGGSGHICNWRRWDRPWLVLWLAGNLLQYGDMLLLSIWLLITGWPWRSLVPASKLLKERSISSNSGKVDHDVLLNCLSLGSKHSKMAVSCSRMMSQMKNYRCHLYWCSLCLSCQMGNWAKTLKTH